MSTWREKSAGASRGDSRRAKHDLLVKKILVALHAARLGRFWPQETGAAYRDNKLIHYGVLGGGDISGIVMGGRRVEIEVKTGKGFQRESQVAFEQMIRAHGGIYILARSVEDALQQLQDAIR